MLRKRRPVPRGHPGPSASILKPVAGLDDALVDNLESFARLDYPEWELLIGIASATDPAAPVVRAFLSRHPELNARVVLTDPMAATNPKVAQLIGLTLAARGTVLVVSDSNVRVGADYLRAVVGQLWRPGVGMVSCLVAGCDERSLGAAIENAQLAAFVAPAVVASGVLADRSITIGKSMAMRAADLARVGGWQCVGDVLAEDDVLGRRFAAEGHAVELCLHPVENPNVACTLTRTMERHTRWAKMRRALLPGAFALEPLLSPAIIASLVMVAAPSTLALQAWLVAMALQCATCALDLRLLRGRWPRWYFAAVEVVRVHVAFACWVGACASRRVAWRGNAFKLGAGSRLLPVEPVKRRARYYG
jgi:ceramide glucosyltransferase